MKLYCLFILCIPCLLSAKTWEVGPGKTYLTPSSVSSLVQDGDTVLIQAGEYIKDVCIWKANNLYLKAVGGNAHLNAQKTAYGGKAIWVIAGNNTTVENIEFSHCEVVDLNGAGIRLEGKNLKVRACYFHDNQEGILAGDNPDSDVIVEYSEFGHNGAGDGYSHNIYINHLHSLLFQYNYVHHAFYGHEVKSRAYTNMILYNRITNEDGSASYEIDLPNGGLALILGNVIQQSHFSDNNTIISYAREGMTNPGPHNLFLVNNTIVNNEDNGIALNIQSNVDTIFSANNFFAGTMKILVGIPKTYVDMNNIVNADLNYFHFNSIANYDYHLAPNSPGIDSAFALNRNVLNYSLTPDKEYVHPASSKPRVNDLHTDIGAHELQQLTKNKQVKSSEFGGYYNTNAHEFILTGLPEDMNGADLKFDLFSEDGKMILTRQVVSPVSIHLHDLLPGLYLYKIRNSNKIISGTFVVRY